MDEKLQEAVDQGVAKISKALKGRKCRVRSQISDTDPKKPAICILVDHQIGQFEVLRMLCTDLKPATFLAQVDALDLSPVVEKIESSEE